MSRIPSKFNHLCLQAVKCRHCFGHLGLKAPLIDRAQPRWVGDKYWNANQKVLLLLLNPGSGAGRKDDANLRLRSMLRSYAEGKCELADVFAHQKDDIPNWGRKRFGRFYLEDLGLKLDEVALGNIAWCATDGNVYPRDMMNHCFRHHTAPLIRLLKPDVVILSGSSTHRFASPVREMLPDAEIVETIHYAHRMGKLKQKQEAERIRKLWEA